METRMSEKVRSLDDSFFSNVYDTALEYEHKNIKRANYYLEHPRDLIDELKQFIFHSEAYSELDDSMQEIIQGCLLFICRHC